jgi:hypothetical protein
VNIHDNVFEEGVEETNGSDYNIIHHNTFVTPTKLITQIGAHTKAYENAGVTDWVYSNAATPTALHGKFYQLDGTSNTVTMSPPGSGAGGIALAAGSQGLVLPQASLTLNSTDPAGYPYSGVMLVPLAASGYAVVNYQAMINGVMFNCSTSSTGTTAGGNTYVVPDQSLWFKMYASNTTHAVTLAVPAGLTINAGGSAFTLTANTIYEVRFAPSTTTPGWFVAG